MHLHLTNLGYRLAGLAGRSALHTNSMYSLNRMVAPSPRAIFFILRAAAASFLFVVVWYLNQSRNRHLADPY